MKVFVDGYDENGKRWFELLTSGVTKSRKKSVSINLPFSIKFDTKAEAENYISSYKLLTNRFYLGFKRTFSTMMLPKNARLWLGDKVNPHTGLKGYLSEWTDEDVYKVFNLSKEEIERVEKVKDVEDVDTTGDY